MTEVPPALRWLLAVLITVGITVGMVRLFHQRARSVGDGETGTATFDLTDRLLALTTTAFVFLLAFTLNNFWQNSKAATTATEAEAGYLARAGVLAQTLPAADRARVRQALSDYQDSVVIQQWPALRRGDAGAAYRVQLEAGAAVTQAVAPDSAEMLRPVVSDLLEQGRQRVDALPGPGASSALLVVFALGIATLAFTAVFRPTRLPVNLAAMAMMAAVVATLLFLVVEARNPYAGGAAVEWTVLGL